MWPASSLGGERKGEFSAPPRCCMGSGAQVDPGTFPLGDPRRPPWALAGTRRITSPLPRRISSWKKKDALAARWMDEMRKDLRWWYEFGAQC